MIYVFVLLSKIRAALSPKKGEIYGDATFVKGTKHEQNSTALPFQALRTFVNNELIERDNGLKMAERCFLPKSTEQRLIPRVQSPHLRTVVRLFALNQPLNPQGRGN